MSRRLISLFRSVPIFYPRSIHTSTSLLRHHEKAGPGNTETMMGSTESAGGIQSAGGELNVGEIEGGTFRVEPLRRMGEDAVTKRARLLCKLHFRSAIFSQP